jgi:hypothetical protein
METHLGKLRKIELNGNSIEEFFAEQCQQFGSLETPQEKTLKTWQDTYEEITWAKKREDKTLNFKVYHVLDGVLYELFDHINFAEDDPHYFKEENGVITFLTAFYNGGGCLEEVLEDEIKKIHLKNNL